ncbi:MAG: MOSC N-terminal beta barrel domain-containing protein [Steroidobacteraceae bacterium]|nr:MOSC N-terminal beta barrel domain-containing protein [Steroidobacteraceae bacterium]MDW8259708.1 MOSC N-terminal beta barrel domain-containing protein [Gammaproteobacteria bacterium]
MWQARIVALIYYPVKSARACEVSSVDLAAYGLQHDRRWLIVDADGRFVSQRTQPHLARLPVVFDGKCLQLGPIDGHPALTVPVPERGAARRRITIWQSHGVALDAGDTAADWLAQWLGQPLRLVYAADGVFERHADPRYAGSTKAAPLAFADGYPILVTNTASLTALNRHLDAPIAMRQFRPNIVLDGLEPWAEDRIGRIEIGAIRLRLCKPCTRCIIPAIDQASGERSTDPTPVLKRLRYNRALRGVTFGENAVIESGVGERLEVGATARCWPRSE